MSKRRINVRAIVWRDGKLLAVKHKNKDGSETEYWAIPGGGLDPQEGMQEGVAREVFEEIGVKAVVGKLLFTQQFMSRRRDYEEELEFFFQVEDSKYFDSIDLAATSHGLDEIAEVAFIDPKAEYILPSFLSEVDIQSYIDAEYTAGIFNNLNPSVLH